VTRNYRTEGIILKRLNLGETDRILTIFSKYHGKIKAIAKGVRRLKSRKGGSLELFNHVSLYLAEGKNFDIITDVEIINNFIKQRQGLKWIAGAFQIAEAIDKLTAEKQSNRQAFELLKKALSSSYQDIVLKFEIELLKELGFGLPKNLSSTSVENFIESIIEKKLNSKKIFSES